MVDIRAERIRSYQILQLHLQLPTGIKIDATSPLTLTRLTSTMRTDHFTYYNGFSPHRSHMNVSVRFLFLLMTGILSIPVLSGCGYHPVTGDYQVSLQDREELIERGRSVYPKYTQVSDGELYDPELQRYVQTLGDQLAQVSHNPDLPFQFNVVNDSTPNAYTLPGGFISITRGLMMELDSESELAAVLGHEIAHAVAQHPSGAMEWGGIMDAIDPGLFSMIGVGDDDHTSYVGLSNLARQGLLPSYSQYQETQADKLAMTYLARAGYDPNGLIELQSTLIQLREETPRSLEQLLATHPLTEERRKHAQSRADDIRTSHDISTERQLRQFKQRVVDTWHPRYEAYRAFDRGVTLAREGDFPPAAEQFRTAMNRYEGEALFYAWLGIAELEQESVEKAKQSLERARSIQPDVFRIQLYSARVFLQAGNHEQSFKHLDRAEKLLPGTPSVTFVRARNYDALSKHNKAAAAYRDYLNVTSAETYRKQYARSRLRAWGYMP